MDIEVINPLTNKKVKSLSAHSQADVKEAISKCHETFLEWRTSDFSRRSSLMRKAAQVLRDRVEDYAHIMMEEMGKTLREGRGEIEKCAVACDHYAQYAEQYLANEKLGVDDGEAYIAYDPLGVVLAVMPWNFPFWQVFRFAAPALMAGNGAILKHASNVPQCALAIEEVFRDAGFPEGLFKSVLIGNEGVKSIIENEKVRAVTLTGSEFAGSKVAEVAGRQLKKTVLELGGSDPFIVLDDADLDKAAETAMKSRMINCGQSCIAAKRFIVQEAVSEEFLKKFKGYMSAVKLGDPANEEMDYGPLAREDLAEKILEQVNKSVEKGAKLILGGKRMDREGAFFEPTILTEVRPGMPAHDEEIFGPVAMVYVVKDDEEAARVANDSQYGLGGSVWTKNRKRGQELARKIESGAVYINAMMASDVRVPFGGIKNSGYGRELSHLGIREFVNIKTVWVK